MAMIMFYVTFPDEDAATKLSDHLIEQKMVACSNIYPMKSSYRWKGNVENDDEWIAIYKTSFKNTGKVESTIEELHPYEVPCIMHWEFSCNFAYEKWLRKNIVE